MTQPLIYITKSLSKTLLPVLPQHLASAASISVTPMRPRILLVGCVRLNQSFQNINMNLTKKGNAMCPPMQRTSSKKTTIPASIPPPPVPLPTCHVMLSINNMHFHAVLISNLNWAMGESLMMLIGSKWLNIPSSPTLPNPSQSWSIHKSSHPVLISVGSKPFWQRMTPIPLALNQQVALSIKSPSPLSSHNHQIWKSINNKPHHTIPQPIPQPH